MSATVDLDACEREPIHVPGAIQPHGALLAVREPGLQIVIASANAGAVLGIAGEAPGHALDALLDDASTARLRRSLAGDPRDANPLEARLADGRDAHLVVHRADGLLVVEVEPAGEDPVRFATAYRRLVRQFDRLRRANSVDELCEIAATQVRKLTGFDRVMVYRLDAHANGQVIAEERADDDLESYLGLHFPASDIPPQARRLYVRNMLRLIVDAEYEPVPLVPAAHPDTGQPLDLSHAVLRSVSPVHCEYLRNMGVRGSMSLSLIDGEELWGLVACHHRGPLHVPYGTRLVAEFLAHVLSARIVELERLETLARKNEAYAVQARLIDGMVTASRFQEGLAGREHTLADLVDCDGAAILFAGEVTRIGEAPTADQVRELAGALMTGELHGVVVSDCLGDRYPPAAAWAAQAAGVIGVPLSAEGGDALFWFRGEQLRAVTWAGDPAKAALPGEQRLRPRASFAAWQETVRGHSTPWLDWEVEVASDFRTALVASVVHQAAALERLNARLVEAGEDKDRFIAAVSHELRNPLNAILGWIKVARMAPDGARVQEALEVIERNAEAQSELIADLLDVNRIQGGRLELDTEPLDLAEVLREAVDTVTPNADAKPVRLVADLQQEGADVVGDRRRLRQVVLNLLGNAIKFSNPGGRVEVTVVRRESDVQLTVSDDGVGIERKLLETIFEPFSQGDTGARRIGLGLGLSIVKSIVELHGGHVEAASAGEGQGAAFTVTLPVATLRVAPERSVPRRGAWIELTGARILLAEDHVDAAHMVAALLEEHGATVTVAQDGRAALAALRAEPGFDLLLSDLDMPEMDGYALVEAVQAEPALQALPAIALTAYTRGGDRARTLTAGFSHHIAKPVDPDELIAVVALVLGRLR